MKKQNKILNFRYFFIFCIALLFVTSIQKETIVASVKNKDKTKPKMTETLSTTEYTNDRVTITMKVTDKSGLKQVKWATGAKKISYFKDKGKILKLDKNNKVSVVVKKNATYTFYALDKAGNSIKKKVAISNIDKTSPSMEINFDDETYTNKDVLVTVAAMDENSGVKLVKYLVGENTIEAFSDNGTMLSVSKKGESTFLAKENGTYTLYVEDKASNAAIQTFNIHTIDREGPTANASYSVMNQQAFGKLKTEDALSGVKSARYLKGSFDIESEKWNSKGVSIDDLKNFVVNKDGIYSIMIEDNAGNATVITLDIQMEMQAVWISFLEFEKSKNYSEEEFKAYIDSMFDNCVNMKMNAVIVQVRAFGDAMYDSDYFPWSYYASGTQGKSLSYDPLYYMVEAAHKRNLEFHAWLNPYRIAKGNTSAAKLSMDNPARIWMEESATKRNVLSYNGSLYYNPSSTDVQELIVNGVKEIVEKYDVDGIHFDDYFYPNLGSNYSSRFDSLEYKEYAAQCKASGITAKSIVTWRRDNVNALVKKTYAAIKNIDKDCVFGISPAGNISNLLSNSSYYVDIKTWLSSSEYVDYICPQIYWSFTHKTAPYKTIVDDWVNLKTSDTVNLYIGLAAYRAGISEAAAKKYSDVGWSEANTILRDQVLYGRDTGVVDGYMYFRYEHMVGKTAAKEMKNVISILN
ncbi:MAG: family 10 glycosylhydrolase [Acetivibrio sp.]